MIKDNERLDILSKKYKIIQQKDYYSVSTDTFLLADFANVPKKDSKRIIELCSGSGAISMLLREKSDAKITMVEIQEELVELSKRNLEYNNISNIEAINFDIKNIKEKFLPSYYDFVVCNPPYFPVDIMPNQKEKNNHSISRHEILCDLSDVVRAIKYLLKQNGKFAIVHRSYRIADIIKECNDNSLAIKRVRFVYGNKNSQNSKIVLIEGSISKVNDIKIEQPMYIYNEDGSYTEEMKEVYGI